MVGTNYQQGGAKEDGGTTERLSFTVSMHSMIQIMYGFDPYSVGTKRWRLAITIKGQKHTSKKAHKEDMKLLHRSC